MKNRPELDGLRALAVLPVMLFHAGLSPGGFVGVDVFFVISGYLITSILMLKEKEGRLSLVEFYERRARRILPALFLVVLACLPLAWWLLLPLELVAFGKSLASVAVFGSNIYFWQHTSYFAIAAELQPLLHTWSLAVEEQFYLLFPVLLVLLFRVARRHLFLILAFGTVASLALSAYMVPTMPGAAFYLLPSRGWELLAGAMLAHLESSDPAAKCWQARLPSRLASIAAAAGMGMLLVAVFRYSTHTPFPGIAALLPVLGTALIIVGAHRGNLTGRMLSSPPLVGVGLVSYGAYLWHQPLLAFGKIWAMTEPSTSLLLGLCAISLVLGYASWRWVEQPVRFGATWNREHVFRMAGVGTGALAVVGGFAVVGDGFPQRFALPTHVTRTFDSSSGAIACFGHHIGSPARDWICPLGRPGLRPSVLIVGDSHARSLFTAFDLALQDAGMSGSFIAASACPPLLGVRTAVNRFPTEGDCSDRNQAVHSYAQATGIELVFLVARWSLYTDAGYDGTLLQPVGRTNHPDASLDASRMAMSEGLATTAAAYRAIGATVIFVTDAPMQRADVPRTYFRAYRSTLPGGIDSLLRHLSVPTRDHQAINGFMNSAATRLASRGSLDILSLDGVYCDTTACPLGTAETAFYFDDNHLTTAGAARVIPTILRRLQTHQSAATPAR